MPELEPVAGVVSSSATVPGIRCPVCNGGSCQPLFLKDGLPLLRCDSCRLAFTPHEPIPQDLPRLYGEDYFTAGGSGYRAYVGEEATHRFQARRYLRRLATVKAPGTLLDVGCAAGFFLDEAKRAGWTTLGLDASPYAARYARETLGLEVRTSGFLEADWLGDCKFDVVTMLNVLEHMADPVAVERQLCALIPSGGLVAIETWDSASVVARLFGRHWHQYDPCYVPYYHCRASLTRLFPSSRWITVATGSACKWISLKRGLEIIADRGRIARRFLNHVARSSMGRWQVPYLTGELLFLILERRPPTDHAPGTRRP